MTYAPGEISVYGEMRAADHLNWLVRGREPEALDRARTLASEMGLPLERRVRGFSHGMKRQLFLAAALAPRARIRILDEPTEGLDPSKRGQVLDLLSADAESGNTILLSSHHLGEVDRVCTRMLFLKEGELLEEEKSRDLHAKTRRALRLRWSGPVQSAAAEAVLGPLGELHLSGDHATLFLDRDDPRPALGALERAKELPPPVSVVWGELSLQELYRELYGTEGV